MAESESPAHCSYEGCTRPVHGDTDKCIFHAPADKKDAQEFRNALAAQIREWRNEKAPVWDFHGWVFVDVDRKSRSLILSRKFNLFRRAVFPAQVNFWAAQFARPSCFILAKFLGYANFASVTFAEEVFFEDTSFMCEAGFIECTFSGKASFESAAFFQLADFEAATFSRHANFAQAAFPELAYFESATFSEDATFVKAVFSKYTSFESTMFLGSVSFESVVFAKEVSFESAVFSGDAIFDGVHFKSKSNFISARFHARADFDEVVLDNMDLSYVAFSIEGHFGLRDIDARASLRWPGPGKRYDKEGNEIKRGTLRLRAARFTGNKGYLDLRGNLLSDDTKLVLEHCDMSRILLGRMEWTRMEIVAPQWRCLGGRRTIGDEYVPRRLLKRPFVRGLVEHFKGSFHSSMPDADTRFDPTSVADTYLLLTKRFREDLKHAWANDFNCGAFAMNRLAPPDQSCLGQKLCSVLKKETHIAPLRWLKAGLYGLLVLLKRYLSLTALYGVSAGYGRSILRPIVWLTLVSLLAGLSYKGLREPAWFIPKVASLRDIYDLGTEAFSNAISVVTFKKSPATLVYETFSSKATVIGAVQIVLTAIMITLTVFAVRRRFRHG